MEKKSPSLTHIKDIITKMLKDSKLSFNPEDAKIWKVWDKAVGSNIAKYARPVWIKDGCLRVGVTDPIWLQELGYMRNEIKEKLNQELGRNGVEKIEFRLKVE